ncbi:DUF6397 family protein [Streptomyces sp. NPDC004111]|uniref:DUF6397 family protein n=1 Tax=Streptomyces sp. NPDC004111 TaxID=3364690 RepID=UPI0036A8EF8C
MVVKEVQQAHATVTAVRAARELGLDRAEFGLAVQLGRIRTVPDRDGGRRRVAREELERLRELERAATAPLRTRLRTVGTAEGAVLMGISPFRFTALARAGYLSPANFYLNRYRAVVWLYLAEELTDFTARYAEMLTGNYPQPMRASLDEGADRRARNWRSRRLGQLLSRSDDPWEQAALFASLLDPGELADLVRDPRESAHLAGLWSGLVPGEPAGQAAREVARRLFVARDRDEIEWIGAGLALALDEARTRRPLPGPDRAAMPVLPGAPEWLDRVKGVRSWLHRGMKRTLRRRRRGVPDRERGAAAEAGLR